MDSRLHARAHAYIGPTITLAPADAHALANTFHGLLSLVNTWRQKILNWQILNNVFSILENLNDDRNAEKKNKSQDINRISTRPTISSRDMKALGSSPSYHPLLFLAMAELYSLTLSDVCQCYTRFTSSHDMNWTSPTAFPTQKTIDEMSHRQKTLLQSFRQSLVLLQPIVYRERW